MSRSSSFLTTTHFCAVPSRSVSSAVQACLSSFRVSCSRYSLIISTQASIQPSEWSLNSFGFLKVFLLLPHPLLLDSVFYVANASSVLLIIPQVLANVMASGVMLACTPISFVIFVELDIPAFVAVLFTPYAVLILI